VRSLYDVNVLIALFDPQHTQHAKAKAWHEGVGQTGWATCPITQNGLLRIVSQPRYTHPATVAELLALLNKATEDKSHEFWPDDISLASTGTLNSRIALTSGALTDVYLLALAVKHSGCLVTLDTRISRAAVTGARGEHLVVL
jgi:uncharacterized protein